MTHAHNDEKRQQRWIEFIQSIDPGISPQAVRLMGDLRKVARAMHQIGQASIASSGLSHAQYLVLMSLYISERVDGRGELNPSEISKQQGTSRNTISSIIRTLEKEELIARHLDEQDRRKFNICLTEHGRHLVSSHSHRHIGIVGGCFNQLTELDQDALENLLTKLTHHLEAARTQVEQPVGE